MESQTKKIKSTTSTSVSNPIGAAFWNTGHNPITGWIPAVKSKKKTKHTKRND